MAATIGRLGVWTSSRQWLGGPDELAADAAALEDAGLSALWIGGSSGDLALHERLLAATDRLVVASGIVDVWTNPPDTVAASHRRITSTYPDRFVLGLGSSHAVLTEPATGEPYVRPLSRLVSYLDVLDGLAHPVPKDERVLAALGPKALEVAATRSRGAHPYLVTPEHTAMARKLMGPDALLAPEQKVLLETEPSAARAAGRRTLSIYLPLPNYVNNWRRLGFDDDDFADGGSDRLVDTFVYWGSVESIAQRVQEHFDAGADHVALQALMTGDPTGRPVEAWRELGAVLGA